MQFLKFTLYLIFIASINSCFRLNQLDCNADLIYENGKTFYNNRLYTGNCIAKYSNGNIMSKQSYKNGDDFGTWIFYFENGKIETEGSFLNGKRIGTWKYYFDNGKIKQISRYDSIGKRNGFWEFYNEVGELINKLEYLDDYLLIDKNSL